MGMQPQCLQLDSVLQTVSVLEAVIRRSFGPDGGQVLFTRDTGQTLLTRHGTRILAALRLEHPLARMVVECVRRHSSGTGDGSKTFVLLLAALLREIQKHTQKAHREGAGAKRLAEALLAFGLDKLSDVITVGVAPHGSSLSDTHTPGQTDTHTLWCLLSAFLHTRISPTHAEIISQLTCELLSHWSCHGDFINEHFPALHTAVSGFPIGCSRLLEGQVIHADFSSPLPLRNHGPIRALVVTEPLEPSLLIGGTVLELGGANRGIESVCVRLGRGLDSVCVILQHLGVSLLLSSVRQSESVLAAVGRYGVCVLECVCEDDLSLFSVLKDRGRPHSLVVCGLTEGQTEQSVCAVRDALHMLRTTWGPKHRTRATERTARTDVMESCCVISVGGTFEFLLHHTLLQHTHANMALLSVPRQIYSHNRRRYLEAHAHTLSCIRNHGNSPDPPETSAVLAVDGSMFESGSGSGVESVSCKYQLILAVLQCLRSLLSVDTVIHANTSTLSHTCQREEDDD
uniref:Bardet-Biedl syndrome 10 n=1 Tax=Hucho hucho TaxID=62062 RepID=A0A4W5JH33_9TELE